MATLVLGTVGRIFGGPLGGIVGAAIGGLVDRSLFGGGGGARETGRVGNLAIQSATYGEPIPIIVGKIRAAGNLIWTSGILEGTTQSGGGKRSGPATTSYSYSASFAVGLAGRAIASVGRIWADGKLVRERGGIFLSPITMRVHLGAEDQPVDPLISAAEGGAAPAYRGLAYAVFEDMPLADYGNRIPNLTFEIIADVGAVDAGVAVRALALAAGQDVTTSGMFPGLAGHYSGHTGTLAEALAPLVGISDAAVTTGLIVATGGAIAVTVAAHECDAQAPHANRAPERRKIASADGQAGALELGFYDTSRDYQPGLQRVRRSGLGSIDQRAITAAMAPDQAKALASQLLAGAQASRVRATLRLPWRYLWLTPGLRIAIAGARESWRIRETRFEAFVLHLELERLPAGSAVPVTASDGGRALVMPDEPAGSTMLHMLDLPILPGDAPAQPRLWAAAAGASPGWRRAGVRVSLDDGVTYAAIGSIDVGTVMGVTRNRLPAGMWTGWDRFGVIDVELLSDTMWLESRPEASVLAGSNLALVGAEIVQFAAVEAISPRRFRLSGLLRGRRGTEALVSDHIVGERFVLLDMARMLAFDPSLDLLARAGRARADGIGDADTLAVPFTIAGRVFRPLAPAHLRLSVDSGDVMARWVRRSRTGFGWTDFVDAPLGEANEVYQVEVLRSGVMVRRRSVVTEPVFAYRASDRLADGGDGAITIVVSQMSATVGPGDAATATIDIA